MSNNIKVDSTCSQLYFFVEQSRVFFKSSGEHLPTYLVTHVFTSGKRHVYESLNRRQMSQLQAMKHRTHVFVSLIEWLIFLILVITNINHSWKQLLGSSATR